MTNLENAVRIIVNDYKTTLQSDYSDWDIHSWSDMIDAFGQDSKGVKALKYCPTVGLPLRLPN